MNETIKLPFYAKLTFVLLSIIALLFLLYVGQKIIIPVIMAFIFAIILRPIVMFLKHKLQFPHVIAVMFSVLIFVTLIAGVLTYISLQVTDIVSDFDKIQKNLTIHIQSIQQYIKENFHLTNREQKEYMNDATNDTLERGKEIIGSTLLSFTDTLFTMIIIPIYTFLILLYRTHFMMFLNKLFKPEYHQKLSEILNLIKVAVKSYILGLIFEMIIVTVLTSIGLSIIGVPYAILLGILTGLLNLIPYIGILVAGVLTIIVSLSGSSELSMIFGVLIVNLIVQLIDNNILVPMVVSSKVEINSLVTIIGIIIGGTIAGVSGMFLAIPIIAILKVIFDRIESLKPWGYLMGDDLPKTYEWHKIKLPLYDFDNLTDTTPNNVEIKIEIVKSPENITSE
ncbi:AI-2E family transporter [Flavobacterium sp.]|uniref:AI-2E family transporter n=1 Tax=Flavobacterium sp. TaxID=239 RepID=UPI0037500D36